MRRAVALIAAVLAVAVVAACGASRPRVWATRAHAFRASVCASVDCGAYAITLNWGAIQWAHPTTGYNVFLNGSQVGATVASSYGFTGMDCGTTFSLGVQAHDGSGDTSQTYTTSYTTPACPAAPQTLNCFGSPSACGYPDVTTVGVQNCSGLTTLTTGNVPAGWTISGVDLLPTTSGTAGSPNTLSGFNITGYFVYTQSFSYIKLSNDCINFNGTLWTGGQGSSEAVWGAGTSNLTVTNSTIDAPGCSPSESSICDSTWQEQSISAGVNATITGNLMYGSVENVDVGSGSLVQGNYMIANGDQAGAHSENMYESCQTGIAIKANTMLNPMNQSGVVYGDTSGCATCPNQFDIENNLMAGGGRIVQECSQETSAGTSTMTFAGNHIARCTTPPTSTAPSSPPYSSSTYCGSTLPNETTNGDVFAIGTSMDTHGFWPNGGGYGVDVDVNCQASGTYAANGSVTWSGNVWDDNGAAVTCS